ncbi:MAG: hypothetical protein OEX97_01740 [Acidimicrobiia bacterium]|nr:hypothetical protein [Acidimicrobiia bacterium]
MKKTIGLLLAVALLVGVMATAAFAAAPGDGIRDFQNVGTQAGNGYAWGFVDEDGDGVSDSFIDEDGDGNCDNYVDADGDGYNDLRGTRGMGGHGPNGACDGENFIDADGDGVCDNAGAGGGQRGMNGGNGHGRSR